MDFPILSPMLGATVSIDENDERLRITDPRPTFDMGLSAVILVIALALVFSPLLPDSIWSSIVAAVVFLFFLFRLLTIPFREVYVFDKKVNQYHLQRQSVFKSQLSPPTPDKSARCRSST